MCLLPSTKLNVCTCDDKLVRVFINLIHVWWKLVVMYLLVTILVLSCIIYSLSSASLSGVETLGNHPFVVFFLDSTSYDFKIGY
jgi:hypothetical protein